ncbi:DUF2642 domain-containing protein [Bacillus aerolatus]|uniref:DUF2642 domain-containing protein n=1 Tax=Bacillus aerolatus TaxID=2653354 RepID=A0A6I1FGR7_9BACI|nr:DUF2642 domain-containing protein [Bacillus aerolatus]KAB7704727.1 DUF2642 domain-containing protein [Bacillus aerolatus]
MSSPYFPETLTSLIGYSIGIFSSDGALIKGNLIAVKKDYLILQNEKDKYFYYHLDQIKSISKNTKDLNTKKINDDYLQAEKLHDILQHCQRSWVTINCHNDQLVTGFLSQVFDDHIILINGEEKIIMQNSYINNIFPGFYEQGDSAVTDHSNDNERLSDNETKMGNELSSAKESETDIEVSSRKESKMDIEISSDKESERDIEVSSGKEPERENESSSDKEPESDIEVPSDKKSEMGIEVSSNKESERDIEVPSSKESEMESESSSHKKPESDIEVSSSKELEMENDSSSDKKPESDIEVSSSKESEMESEQEIDTVDYSYFDQRLRSNLASRKKSSSTAPNKQTRQPSASNDFYIKKRRNNKKIKISRKEIQTLHAGEKQSVKQQPVCAPEDYVKMAKPVLTLEEKERLLESQYYSLMKQAEKNYLNLKTRRINREKMK